MSRLFIIDDDVETSDLLCEAAELLFSHAHVFNNARLFLAEKLLDTDIIILDLMMPDVDGIEVIRHLAKNTCQAKLVLISGYDAGVLHSAEALARDHGLNVVGDFTKPISIVKLMELLSRLMGDIAQEKLNAIISEPSHKIHYEISKIKSVPVSNTCEFIPNAEDLQNAIDNDQLELHYQPQIKFKLNKLIGVEALVRWFHPEHGLIYPDKFVPLAEKTGLIEQLTEKVIDIAVGQSAIWKRQGLDIKISVNISSRNVTSLQLPEQLTSLVTHNQIDPSMLVLEVTESALMGELTTSLDILTRLRLKGFQLSIDDFGTGFSSLSQLHRVPFTELKIDRSFIANMSKEPESCAIVETCIMLGHKLNMEVVAEGIENHKTSKLLKQLGCDIGQGYHIAKPMNAVKLFEWAKSSDVA